MKLVSVLLVLLVSATEAHCYGEPLRAISTMAEEGDFLSSRARAGWNLEARSTAETDGESSRRQGKRGEYKGTWVE